MAPPSSPLAPLQAARIFLDRLQKPAILLVAVSGGSDSTGLLLALNDSLRLFAEVDVKLEVVTIDHALRPEAADEAVAVAQFCHALAIPHHSLRWTDEKPNTGVSAAARLARYRLIGEVADKIGATAVVVGHTRDDQRETITMRSHRNAAQDRPGLSGMADAVLYNSRHWVLRPFLNVRRQDIRDYLVTKNQGWFDDPSNEDVKYERVRVRKMPEPVDLAPAAPSLERAELASRAAAFVSRAVDVFPAGLIRLHAEHLGENAGILRYAISALACVAGGRPYPLAADSLNRVMEFLAGGMPGRLTAGRVVFDRRKDGLYLMRENRDVPRTTISPGATIVWDGRFEITNRSDVAMIVSGEGCADTAREGQGDCPNTVPSGFLKRARSAQPHLRPDTAEEAGEARVLMEAISIRPLLAPYDLFLTRFDLDLANAIAVRLGREAYPQLPITCLGL